MEIKIWHIGGGKIISLTSTTVGLLASLLVVHGVPCPARNANMVRCFTFFFFLVSVISYSLYFHVTEKGKMLLHNIKAPGTLSHTLFCAEQTEAGWAVCFSVRSAVLTLAHRSGSRKLEQTAHTLQFPCCTVRESCPVWGPFLFSFFERGWVSSCVHWLNH